MQINPSFRKVHNSIGFYNLMYLPFMHPGNLLPSSLFMAFILIQLPSWPLTPSLALGMDSRLSSVQMYVLDSTRATSRGSVRAKKLWNMNSKISGLSTEIYSYKVLSFLICPKWRSGLKTKKPMLYIRMSNWKKKKKN